jgi:hypothetical protein
MADALTKLGATTEKASENMHILKLREIVAGVHDSIGFKFLLFTIEGSIMALHRGGELVDDAHDLANNAITHWARRVEASGALEA